MLKFNKMKSKNVLSIMMTSMLAVALTTGVTSALFSERENQSISDKELVPTKEIIAEKTKVITTSVVTTTKPSVTTTIVTTSTLVSTSTTAEVSTSITESEIIKYNETEFINEESEEEVAIEEEYVEEIEETYESDNSNMTYYQSMEGTYYCGGYGTYGRWGRDLISGYSVAINGLDDGTIVYIESDCPGVTGIYRVDDTGGMGYSVVDFYYQYDCVPSEFSWRGRINVEVYIVN